MARTTEPEIRHAVESFLRSARRPAVLEEGAEPIPLGKNQWALESDRGRLTLVAWDRGRVLSRRVVAAGEPEPGRLTLTVTRFGNKQGQVVLYDILGGRREATERRAVRMQGRELLRDHLSRQFPGWKIAACTAEAHLEHSLSPAYPRALVTRASRGWAAILARNSASADGALTYGLIWLDYLRRRERNLWVEGLALFLPEGSERVTSLRLSFLNANAARFLVFSCSPDGREHAVDPRDYGNLDSQLEPPSGPAPSPPQAGPEAYLESRVRGELDVLDASLGPEPVYGQVPAFTGADRGILDLLAADRAGRLAVIELKVTADPHLPLQALDYWMRVERHLGDGSFTARGYFPGVRLAPESPRLLLVAPALEFHSTTESMLRWLSPRIQVDRIGLTMDWRRELRVAFRASGCRRPGLG